MKSLNFDPSKDCFVVGKDEMPHKTQPLIIWIASLLIALLSQNAFARQAALNPTSLGPFCPAETTLVTVKKPEAISLKEQLQIKRAVQGFMRLDADARRSYGHLLGESEYWEKNYTPKFDAKNSPAGGVEYLDWRLLNICTSSKGAVAVVVLDVDLWMPRILPAIFKGRKISTSLFWDGFSKQLISPPNSADVKIPAQPVVLTTLPFTKHENDLWLIDQTDVPTLAKFNRQKRQREIDLTNSFADCSSKKKRPKYYSPERCAAMEKNKLLLLDLNRPAWTVIPADYKPKKSK